MCPNVSTRKRAARTTPRDDAFHDGVLFALQGIEADGLGGDTAYMEILKASDIDMLLDRALEEDMVELTGIAHYVEPEQAVKAALRYLRKHRPNSDVGICSEVGDLIGFGCAEIERMAKEWPEHSGNSAYPVPHPTKDPHAAFYAAKNCWSRSTEYGRARWRLLNWMLR